MNTIRIRLAASSLLCLSLSAHIALDPGTVYGQVTAADPARLAERECAPAPSPTHDIDALGDFADPFVFRDGNVYYALGTNGNGSHVQIASSMDLRSWRTLPDALPRLPSWAASATTLTWAPAVLRRGARWVLYYTTGDRESGFQCISRAVSQHPMGPYVDDTRRPFICQIRGEDASCGSIDPSPFVDHDGTPYLYWKSDENSVSCQTAPRIWVQRLSPDGLRLEGRPETLLTRDRDWEGQIIEGPSLLLNDGAYYLFYSANWYASAHYAVGYARCRGPMGPCEKVTRDAPWFSSRGNLLGPGGQEFFSDATGQAYMAYHAWTGPEPRYGLGDVRGLRLAPLEFSAGVPRLSEPAESCGMTASDG